LLSVLCGATCNDERATQRQRRWHNRRQRYCGARQPPADPCQPPLLGVQVCRPAVAAASAEPGTPPPYMLLVPRLTGETTARLRRQERRAAPKPAPPRCAGRPARPPGRHWSAGALGVLLGGLGLLGALGADADHARVHALQAQLGVGLGGLGEGQKGGGEGVGGKKGRFSRRDTAAVRPPLRKARPATKVRMLEEDGLPCANEGP
jgi:hypothetical protein